MNSRESGSKLDFFLFNDKLNLELSDSQSLRDYIKIIKLGDFDTNLPQDVVIPESELIQGFEHYGTIAGLYWVWKNVNTPYIGFSFTNHIPKVSKEELDDFFSRNYQVLNVKKVFISGRVEENYRSRYYGYDFRMLMSLLKKNQSTYYSYCEKDFIESNTFMLPCCIMRKEEFRKFCAWLFPLLEQLIHYLGSHFSVEQNKYLEHLSFYLLGIYLGKNSKSLKTKTVESSEEVKMKKEEVAPPPILMAPLDRMQFYMDKNIPEKAYELVKNSSDFEGLDSLKILFERYERERRYYKTTIFDESSDLKVLTQKYGFAQAATSRKVLVIKWNSISHEETLKAFEALSLEYESLDIGDINFAGNERFLDQINRHLDYNNYSFVFSLNYFPLVAEACFIHSTPYLAWTYDSPVMLGNHKYIKYDTTHLFMFDSAEVDSCHEMNLKNVEYMPLAVNVERYDKIKCSKEDIERFGASISFVGQLYENKLSEAISHIPDYDKAFINSIIDQSLGIYDYTFCKMLITQKYVDSIKSVKFHDLINSEWPEFKQGEKTTAGRVAQLINKTITNRERLLLISMLSNHFDFKLYSTSSHEVFSNTIECGRVDYYNEMPKVFKCSKINLNMTFRSIQTGLPLRCLDIMGCHGLLLSNYQRDFRDHFADQKNVLLYHSLEEAYDKVEYYLSHESERKAIENAGYETVKKYYNYPILMREAITKAGLSNLLK